MTAAAATLPALDHLPARGPALVPGLGARPGSRSLLFFRAGAAARRRHLRRGSPGRARCSSLGRALRRHARLGHLRPQLPRPRTTPREPRCRGAGPWRCSLSGPPLALVDHALLRARARRSWPAPGWLFRGFLVAAYLWAYWHLVRQHYGFLVLYRRRAGETDAARRPPRLAAAVGAAASTPTCASR